MTRELESLKATGKIRLENVYKLEFELYSYLNWVGENDKDKYEAIKSSVLDYLLSKYGLRFYKEENGINFFKGN